MCAYSTPLCNVAFQGKPTSWVGGKSTGDSYGVLVIFSLFSNIQVELYGGSHMVLLQLSICHRSVLTHQLQPTTPVALAVQLPAVVWSYNIPVLFSFKHTSFFTRPLFHSLAEWVIFQSSVTNQESLDSQSYEKKEVSNLICNHVFLVILHHIYHS